MDEKHVLLHCLLYQTIMSELVQVASQINNDFCNLLDIDNVGCFLSHLDIVFLSAKSVIIFQIEENLLCLIKANDFFNL